MLEELAKSLRKRLEIIEDQKLRESNPEEQLRRLAEVSEKIDALVHSLPQDIHPRLAHYLSRASYSKALEFLESELLRR